MIVGRRLRKGVQSPHQHEVPIPEQRQLAVLGERETSRAELDAVGGGNLQPEAGDKLQGRSGGREQEGGALRTSEWGPAGAWRPLGAAACAALPSAWGHGSGAHLSGEVPDGLCGVRLVPTHARGCMHASERQAVSRQGAGAWPAHSRAPALSEAHMCHRRGDQVRGELEAESDSHAEARERAGARSSRTTEPCSRLPLMRLPSIPLGSPLELPLLRAAAAPAPQCIAGIWGRGLQVQIEVPDREADGEREADGA